MEGVSSLALSPRLKPFLDTIAALDNNNNNNSSSSSSSGGGGGGSSGMTKIQEAAWIQQRTQELARQPHSGGGGGGARVRAESLVKALHLRLLLLQSRQQLPQQILVAAINATADVNNQQPFLNLRLAHLCCSAWIQDQDLALLLVTSFLRNLHQTSPTSHIAMALDCFTQLATIDMCTSIIPLLTQHLRHESAIVRKKTVLAFKKIFRINPALVSHLISVDFKRLLGDRDPTVMEAALVLWLEIIKTTPSHQHSKSLTDPLLHITNQLLAKKLPRTYDYKGVMSPWILINCISLLSELGKSSSSGSNDLASIVEAASAVFEKVYSFLVKLLADKSRHLQQQQQQQHQKQPGSGSGGGNGGGDGESDADQSITYEIIKSLLNLIFNTPNSIYTHIHSDKNKEDSIDLTSHLPLVTLHLKSYLASASSTFKYLGLNLLSTTATKAAVSVSSPSNFNHVHANNILASCLDDIKFCIVDLLKSDGNSILKRKALDLLSALANKENYSACADQLLTLATATIQLHHRRFYQSGSFPSTSSTINTAFTSSDGTISSLAFVFNKLVQVIQHSPLGAEQVKWVWRLVEATTTTAKASSLSSPASTSVTSPSKSKSFAPLYTRIAFHLTQMVAHTTSSKINSDDRGDDLKECRKICLEYWIKLVCDGGGENSSSSSSSHVSEFLDGSLGQFGFWLLCEFVELLPETAPTRLIETFGRHISHLEDIEMVMEVVRSTKVILAHFKIQCPLSFMTSLEEVKNSHHDNLKLQQRCIEFMSTVETLQLYPAPSDDTEASKSASVSALIHPIGVDVSSKGETQQEIEMESVSLPPPPPAHSPPPQPVFSESDQRLVKSLFAGVSSSNAIPTRSRSPNSSSYGSASPTPSLLVDIDDGQAISEMKLF